MHVPSMGAAAGFAAAILNHTPHRIGDTHAVDRLPGMEAAALRPAPHAVGNAPAERTMRLSPAQAEALKAVELDLLAARLKWGVQAARSTT